ncbi:subtilase-type protease inhibitor [Streptomyces longwoodensis]|uniref:SSI family serine proteinase inhibitor n=1 Tax=Streptomyces longwoodensis TaxID=68231 RepID=UPI002ED15212|nr:subtilase-type protease inhibitor [Streptomyces longwoodensis]
MTHTHPHRPTRPLTAPTALRRALPVAAALLLAGAGATTATATTAGPLPVTDPAPAAGGAAPAGSWLELTVTPGAGRSGGPRGALLLCDPPQGHSRAAEACAQLTAAHGDVRAVPRRDAVCPLVYAPVAVRAHGQWDGRPVDYRETFANRCELEAATGAVFALDD